MAERKNCTFVCVLSAAISMCAGLSVTSQMHHVEIREASLSVITVAVAVVSVITTFVVGIAAVPIG